MKILTLNVHAWMEEESAAKLEKLAEVISQKDYDFVALQEVNQPLEEKEITDSTFIKPRREMNQKALKKGNFAKILVDELRKNNENYYWSWSANHVGYDIYDEGLAFLSKVPFELDSLLISKTEKFENIFTRNILKVSVQVDSRKLTFINGHFSWWQSPSDDSLFKDEWDKTLEAVEEDEKETLFAMGDFNNEAGVREEGYDYLVETAGFLNDSFKVAEEISGEYTVPGEIAGWANHFDGKRIDYIFSGPHVAVQSHKVVFDGRKTPVVSDHYGVEIKFEIKS